MRVYTGRARFMEGALIERLRELKDGGAEFQIVVVPKQLTLQTERMLLQALKLQGSFALQVLSPERLCHRIFESAGEPEGERIDERGRVMIARTAIRDSEDALTLYKGYQHRRGFPDRCARQLELLRQAGLKPEQIADCADQAEGLLSSKLRDLSTILKAYEERVEGRFQDGEAEFFSAAARAASADFLKDSNVIFYGFDLTPPALHRLMASVAAVSPTADVFLPVVTDPHARDLDIFEPLKRCYGRLRSLCGEMGVPVEERAVEGISIEQADELKRLSDELYAFPALSDTSEKPPRHIQLASLRNPMEEALFAAALCRRLAMTRGWRWNDFLILCHDTEGYHQTLQDAFQTYDVPLFLSSSRPAARHALSECLLTALKLMESNGQTEDALALLQSGYMPLEGEEIDRLNNHIVKYNLRPYMLLKPLKRGTEAELLALEPLREKLVNPLIHLKEALRASNRLPEQLSAVFGFLEEIGARDRLNTQIDRLCEAELRQAASESAQVWNRLIGALDQMAALMGEKKLSLRELRETLTESLEAAVIKPLPQADDAVFVQPADRVLSRPVKALLILGETDRTGADPDGLFNVAQLHAVMDMTHAYLGSDDQELSMLKRYYLKAALEKVSDYVCVTWPLSGMDNGAQHPSQLIAEIRGLFPKISVRGGVSGDAGLQWMLRSAPKAALSHVSRALSEGQLREWDAAALSSLMEDPGFSEELRLVQAALHYGEAADSLNPETAQALYGKIRAQSISRLERHARCPFAYFTEYGLKPQRIDPFVLTPLDEGSFFHNAVHEFLNQSKDDIQNLAASEARERMDIIANQLLKVMVDRGPLGDGALALAERRRLAAIAGTCAEILAEHMRGSRFQPTDLEASFGPEDGSATLTIDAATGRCALEGRIDRIDRWLQGDYLRVIDYKRGGRPLDLGQVYYGQSLQLPVYLAAAMKQTDAKSAGVYYFKIDEGLYATQSTDINAVEKERRDQFKMTGLAVDDPEALVAQSPNFTDVLNLKVNKDGSLSKTSLATNQQGFEALTRHTLKKAAEVLDDIRSGGAEVAPAEYRESLTCQWCDLRDTCLFDANLDAPKVRRFKAIKQDEALKLMQLERDQ